MLRFLFVLFVVLRVSEAASWRPRIVNGTDASPGEIPYIVSLRFNSRHICGGSILNEKYVLTAAHCVYNSPSPVSYSIQYGLLQITHDNTNSIDVRTVTYHEDYVHSDGWINDVAVLELEASIPLSQAVKPIALPTADAATPDWSTVVLAGWGYQYTGGSVMETLQRVGISIFPDDECEVAHEGEAQRKYHICAGVQEGGKGQCTGDSGGPLALNGVQYGIVSWSVKPCAIAGYPGVYTRVAAYINWIKEHTVN